MSNQYYLQDNRQYVGNDVLWWAKDRCGYTTDISKAHVFTKEEAVKQNHCRETDIPWPKEYIDGKTRPAVDMQYIDIEIALQGTEIELKKPKPFKKEQYRCECTGKFISEEGYYSKCYPSVDCAYGGA